MLLVLRDPFQNCRMIVDCTDIKMAIPKQMDIQKETYSAYRGMHSFKLLLGVAPNAVITYCSKLYPGSTSDKEIATKLIAQNRIHVERANARFKEFRILKFIPSHLRHFSDKL
ncbi:hypothetical protein F7725_025639, partial [Dissostichus mawsoni]